MHIPKKGLRALGIAESYAGRDCSTLAGVVMRKDLRIDGFIFGRVTVGGTDATDAIIRMIRKPGFFCYLPGIDHVEPCNHAA